MRKRTWMVLIVSLILTLLFGTMATALSGEAIDWWVIASGGAPVSGGNVTMNGTLGQPVIGLSEGNEVDLSAGYWVEGMGYRIYLPVVLR